MTDDKQELLWDLLQEYKAEHDHLKHGATSVECMFCGWNPFLVVTDSWEFHVPRTVPSLNEIKGKNKKTLRWKYRSFRDSFQKDIAILLYNMSANSYDANKNGRPTKRRVIMTRLMGKGEKTYDQDNLIGGCKPILDALTRNDIIVDDSKRWLVIHYKQERDRNNPGLHIRVEELTE